jgi:ubiquinone/menaquinone biosynthesis C-methylase UbiE
MKNLTSRFISNTDENSKEFFFKLHPSWWSRFYEYPWASQFVNREDVVLDAASGICHPLKFYLMNVARETHACDIDPRILQPDKILEDVEESFGADAKKKLSERHLKNIYYSQASLTNLPYPDKKFDKIFCISVLEHLPDYFNKHANLWGARNLLFSAKRDIYYSLKEFKRTLKDDGLLILTFDYPSINLKYLSRIMTDIGMSFMGNVSFDLPEDALYSRVYDLYCFRAVLKKQSLD